MAEKGVHSMSLLIVYLVYAHKNAKAEFFTLPLHVHKIMRRLSAFCRIYLLIFSRGRCCAGVRAPLRYDGNRYRIYGGKPGSILNRQCRRVSTDEVICYACLGLGGGDIGRPTWKLPGV